jgi:predicted hydrocarbon binding protein
MVETTRFDEPRRLLKGGARVEQRVSAARDLSMSDDLEAIRVLIAVAQEQSASEELAREAGRSLAKICARRRQDLDDLVMASMPEHAYMTYDREIARQQHEDPALKMERGEVGSGL